ncbi:MAG TPA: hypothetical protein VJH37_03830 [Candidatus Nanoarchaeia archaeon]|nr:hypothetical protein [Candidatus Nanoarchaeia archaeon]
MSIILSNYLHEYRTRLSERAHSIPLHQAIIAFTKEYRDHARTVSKQIDLASRYRMSKDHPLAKSLLREARLSLLLALEDLHGLEYLAGIHPHKRSFIEREVAVNHGYLMELAISSFHTTPQFFPPPRSA